MPIILILRRKDLSAISAISGGFINRQSIMLCLFCIRKNIAFDAGFIMVLIFYNGGSLIPCIVFYSVNNALKGFSAGGSMDPKVEMILNLVLIVVVLGGYLLYLVKVLPNKKASE